MSNKVQLVIVSVSQFGVMALSHAQETESADAGVLQEVVVTATGRSAGSSDVPLAISVASGEDLARSNITSLENLTAIEPAINVRNYGPGINSFIIRGIVSQAQPTTGIYFDEAPLIGGHQTEGSGDTTPTLRLIDLNRLEVLKGPQGTLFGAGSMAGTIRAITNKPNTEGFTGDATVMTGQTKGGNALHSGNVVLNVPLASTFAVRAVGWAEEGGGFIDAQPDVDGQPGGTGKLYKNANDVSVRGGRMSALWEPTDAFDLGFSYTKQKIEADGTTAVTQENSYYNSLSTLMPFDDDLDIYSATANLRAAGGTFTANVARTSYDRFRVFDTTASTRSFLPFYGVNISNSASFNQDVQLHGTTAELRYSSSWEGPFQLVTGAYYQKDKTKISSIVVNTDIVTGLPPCRTLADCLALGLVSQGGDLAAPGDVQFGITRHHKTEQKAFYAQGEYKFLEDFTATVGARYFTADLDDDSTNDRDIVNFVDRTIATGTTRTFKPATQSKASYNFSLTWQPLDNLTTYARAASGFRIGGLNDAEDALRNFGIVIPSSYTPDSLWDYELGVKAALFDRRVLLDGTVFHIDWEKQQLPGLDPTGTVSFTYNAAKTKVDGIELTLRSLPIEHLSIDAGMTYVRAELATDLPGDTGRKGDQVPNNPELSASLQSEYYLPAFENWDAYFGGGVTYQSKSENFFESDPRAKTMPSVTIVGLRTGMRTDRVDVGLVADNVFDEYAVYGIFAVATGGGFPDHTFVGRPRTVSLRLTARF